jgi:two-component system, LytTR family, response regulator
MIKVVIVDDEPVIFEPLTEMLQNIDPVIKVIGTAATKRKAIELITETTPDVVFVDINMPRGSGLELLEKFPTRKFQVVFISGYAALEPFTKKYAHLGFLNKPIDEVELKKIVEIIKQNFDNEDGKVIRNENIL